MATEKLSRRQFLAASTASAAAPKATGLPPLAFVEGSGSQWRIDVNAAELGGLLRDHGHKTSTRWKVAIPSLEPREALTQVRQLVRAADQLNLRSGSRLVGTVGWLPLGLGHTALELIRRQSQLGVSAWCTSPRAGLNNIAPELEVVARAGPRVVYVRTESPEELIAACRSFEELTFVLMTADATGFDRLGRAPQRGSLPANLYIELPRMFNAYYRAAGMVGEQRVLWSSANSSLSERSARLCEENGARIFGVPARLRPHSAGLRQRQRQFDSAYFRA